jgi:electron transport complex protein RnfB
MQKNMHVPMLAIIRESECIGCTKCIQACPVDAIVGAAKHLHSILADECTGCGLCVEPCPVDCIDMVAATPLQNSPFSYDPGRARQRFQAKQIRQLQHEHSRQAQYQAKRRLAAEKCDGKSDRDAKQAYILQALARVKEKKNRE